MARIGSTDKLSLSRFFFGGGGSFVSFVYCDFLSFVLWFIAFVDVLSVFWFRVLSTQVVSVGLEDEIKTSFMQYAMSIILVR